MKKKNQRASARGAVLAEFVIAVVPVLMMLFGWMQLAWLYTANLLVKHAANVCVRAAAVADDKSFNPPKGKNGGDADIQKATEMAANVQGPRGPIFTSIKCKIDNEASEGDVFGTVTATVTAEYACRVPMGKLIVCGPSAKKTLVRKAQMPFQGAHYKVDP